MVRRIRHRLHPQQLRRVRRDSFSHDDDSLHWSRRLLAQASLSTLRPPEVPGVDAPPLQDVRQAERGRSRANHPHRFCRCSGTKCLNCQSLKAAFSMFYCSEMTLNAANTDFLLK